MCKKITAEGPPKLQRTKKCPVTVDYVDCNSVDLQVYTNQPAFWLVNKRKIPTKCVGAIANHFTSDKHVVVLLAWLGDAVGAGSERLLNWSVVVVLLFFVYMVLRCVFCYVCVLKEPDGPTNHNNHNHDNHLLSPGENSRW